MNSVASVQGRDGGSSPSRLRPAPTKLTTRRCCPEQWPSRHASAARAGSNGAGSLYFGHQVIPNRWRAPCRGPDGNLVPVNMGSHGIDVQPSLGRDSSRPSHERQEQSSGPKASPPLPRRHRFNLKQRADDQSGWRRVTRSMPACRPWRLFGNYLIFFFFFFFFPLVLSDNQEDARAGKFCDDGPYRSAVAGFTVGPRRSENGAVVGSPTRDATGRERRD